GDATTYRSRYNAASAERTGDPDDPGGTANDYRVTGSATVTVHASTLSGSVYHDADGDGARDGGEAGIFGAVVTLTGTDHLGAGVGRPAVAGFVGSYAFPLLRPGTYTVTEPQPAGWADGLDAVGTPALGATVQANDQLGVFTFPAGADTAGVNNNFGE